MEKERGKNGGPEPGQDIEGADCEKAFVLELLF